MQITPENFFDKLCFAVFGSGLETCQDDLQTFLLTKARKNEQQGKPKVSRPTIYGWFKDAKVSREVAWRFLFSVIQDVRKGIDTDDLSADQKKVADRLMSHCRKHFSERNRNVIKELPGGAIQLRGIDRFDAGQLANEIEYYEGSYLAIKSRSGDETDDFLSVEYFEIFREEGALCVNWLFLIDSKRLEKFEGAVYFMGDWVWIVLHSPLLGGRFRQICLDGRGWGRRDPDIRGGLLLGTSPHATASVPTTNRLVIQPWQTLGTKSEKLREMGHIGPTKLKYDYSDAILAFMTQEPVVPGRIDAEVATLLALK